VRRGLTTWCPFDWLKIGGQFKKLTIQLWGAGAVLAEYFTSTKLDEESGELCNLGVGVRDIFKNHVGHMRFI